MYYISIVVKLGLWNKEARRVLGLVFIVVWSLGQSDCECAPAGGATLFIGHGK